MVRGALEVVLLDKKVSGVLFNVFGGITRCDEVAKRDSGGNRNYGNQRAHCCPVCRNRVACG